MIRVIVLWSLMPEAQLCDVIHGAGRGPGPGALVETMASRVGAGLPGLAQGARPGPAGGTAGHGAGRREGEHAGRDGQSLTIGKNRPLAVHSGDGSLLRVPDTPLNRAEFGSVGTSDDSAAWPSVRLFPLSNVLTRSLLAMPSAKKRERTRPHRSRRFSTR